MRVHVCLLDHECWLDWWRYGMPMRIHWGQHFWTVPGFNWRYHQLWDDAEEITMDVDDD